MSTMDTSQLDPTSAALMQALSGGGGAAGPPAGPDIADTGGTGPGSSADALLGTAIDALTQYVAHGGSDNVDSATAAQCLAKLKQIQANDQKNNEAAMGTTPAHKAIAKSRAGGY